MFFDDIYIYKPAVLMEYPSIYIYIYKYDTYIHYIYTYIYIIQKTDEPLFTCFKSPLLWDHHSHHLLSSKTDWKKFHRDHPMIPGLVNCYKTDGKITMLLMGKSTMSTGPFSSLLTLYVYQRVFPWIAMNISHESSINKHYPPVRPCQSSGLED